MKSKLNKDKIIEKIEKNKKDIQKYQVKKIGVFGSFIKKNQGSNSDVDILVVFGKVDFEKYTGLKFMLEKMFKRKVDLVIEEDLRPELNYIKKEVQYAKI
ncbi:nucleotidyltransferase domain-containing protein [Candidatus Pacearchaeota archaeon]|nr:nucleotidyltransferase domain-containing protein [Candidatus Pacearchaeota archaeon]